jgi:hypothetical protein
MGICNSNNKNKHTAVETENITKTPEIKPNKISDKSIFEGLIIIK